MSRCCRFLVPPVSRITSSFPSRPKYTRYPGPKLIRYSSTPSPTPLTFDRLPCSSRAMATVTFARAVGIQRREPAFERAAPIRGQVVADFEHRPNGNIGVTDRSIRILHWKHALLATVSLQ